MSWTNYQDVLSQMQAGGLQVSTLDVGILRRCRTEDSRERRGWYIVHELMLDSGEAVLVGSYGIWHGQDHHAQKITLPLQSQLTEDQRQALKIRLREDHRRAETARKAGIERAARRADAIWHRLPVTGRSAYLERKGVQPFGLKFSPTGAAVVPMCNETGRVFGLQFLLDRSTHAARIRKTGRDKEFWPAGLEKKGKFHLLGGTPTWVILLCEGYATGASLHMATGLPVVVAFDCGNLLEVAQIIHKRYRSPRILVCADDDYLTDGNPGTSKAATTALVVGGAWIAPIFSRDRAGSKLTDFNDVHALEGLAPVRAQIEQKLAELQWSSCNSARATTHAGGGGEDAADFHFDIDLLLREYTLIYSTETVFDGRRRMIIGMGSLRAAAGKSLVRMWLEHPARRTVLPDQVVFDPAGRYDPETTCNLWAGWPTSPKSGCCERHLELLRYLCSNEQNADEVFDWIMRWTAYPIQHPGSKMQTALLMHGPEGSGKNTYFGAIRKIYERYGGIFDQTQLESQFNGWASGKLFAIGNEVVTRVEFYHIQGRLKNMVTETEWQINEKNLPCRLEANHCNFVFFSNRLDIAKLDQEDRRYCVVWTPPAVGPEFYREVADEAENGGIEALHDHLLHLDLGDFDAHAKPPKTRSKSELIELSQDSTERFWAEWTSGEMDVPVVPCLADDFYKLYRSWCLRRGIPKTARHDVLVGMVKKKPGAKHERGRYFAGQAQKQQRFVFPPGKTEPPPAERSIDWLTKCSQDFAHAIDLMRDAA